MRLPFRRAVVAPALVAVTTSAAVQQPSLPRTPGEVVQAAERAVTARRAAAVRQDWLARLRREPSNRLARLGVAAFARLAYDYAAADSLRLRSSRSPVRKPTALPRGRASRLRSRSPSSGESERADSLLTLAATEAAAAGDGSAEGAALARLALIRGRTQGVDAGLALLDRATRVLPPHDSTRRALALAYRAQLVLARGTPGAGPLADSALRLARLEARHASKGSPTTSSDASSCAFGAPIPPRCCSGAPSSASEPPVIWLGTPALCNGAATCCDRAGSSAPRSAISAPDSPSAGSRVRSCSRRACPTERPRRCCRARRNTEHR